MKENRTKIIEFLSATQQAEKIKAKILKSLDDLMVDIFFLGQVSKHTDTLKNELRNSSLDENENTRFLEIQNQYSNQLDISALPLFTKFVNIMEEITGRNIPANTNRLEMLAGWFAQGTEQTEPEQEEPKQSDQPELSEPAKEKPGKFDHLKDGPLHTEYLK
jgi:hypothetical protein